MIKTINTGTTAIVNVTVQIRNLGTWDTGAPMGQVLSQAIEEAMGKLRKKLNVHDFSIVGDPCVQVITNFGQKAVD